MPITRRSLLQTLGALPAAWCFRTLPAVGQTPKPCPTTPAPSPNSIFVLIEGPWLIFPNPSKNSNANTMTALTVGYSLDHPGTGPFRHECVFQRWNNGHPQGGPVPIDPDHPWTITSSATPARFADVISDAWNKSDGFVWAYQENSLQTQTGDRSLSLQVPTRIHIAGIQRDATVSGQELFDQPVKPHVVTILQYDPPASGKLSLTVSGGIQQIFNPGDQLVFRMRHLPKDQNVNAELQHVHDSFDFIRKRLSNGNTIRLQITDTDYYCGDSDGFSDEEMGLHRLDERHAVAEYSNCCGGSIIGGGNGGDLEARRAQMRNNRKKKKS
jgi:hypothetical protein